MSNILNKRQIIATGSFGEVDVVEGTPEAQITAQYGLLDNVFTATIGGSVSTDDSNFVAQSGTLSSGIAVISTKKQVQYKAGQGIKALFTALFDTPAANNIQFSGLQNSESLIGFGYNGTEFGIGIARDGALSVRELQVTTGAAGSENATVTVDGNDYIVPLTAGGINLNAYQIAVYLNANVPAFDFASNEDTVYSLANLPQLGTNTFAFSSATADASWTEKTVPNVPTPTWTPISQWSEKPNFPIDTSKGNVFKIQFQYLGYGGIKFFIEDSDTAEFVHVHTIKYANKNTIPSVSNPIFRLGWLTNNQGNTTNVTIKGASAAVFVEGKKAVHGQPMAECAINASVGTTATNMVSLRNRMVLNDLPNRASIETLLLSVSTETNATAIFDLYKQAETPSNDPLIWTFKDELTSIAEISKSDSTDPTIDSPAVISGGELIGCFPIKEEQSQTVDLTNLVGSLAPQEYITVSARVTNGAASEMFVTLAWKEDK